MSLALYDDLDQLSRRDTFDSRDALKRVHELEDREDDEDDPLDEDEKTELKEWRELIEETEGYAGDNWRDGIQFIAEEHFEKYAEELADSIGAIDSNASWPLDHIDWKAAADSLKQDYTSVDIHGNEFWYR
jgi:hypothetical protein